MQRAKSQAHRPNHNTMWVKPQEGMLKCNVDAAMFQNNAIEGYGLCFRNSMGQFIIGKSAFSSSPGSVLEAEAIALFEAFKMAISCGFLSVHFETDNKTLVDAVHSNSTHINEFGDIVSQWKDILTTNTDFKVSYIRRQANRVAHTIARASLSQPSPHIFHIVPSTLYSLIMNETI